MGIQGLLPTFADAQRDSHIRDFRGLTAAVDAHGWLHAGLAGCALELLTGGSRGHINFCLKRAGMLRRFGVEPIMVFDGDPLPAKLGTQLERKQRREAQRREGEERLRAGDMQGARSCFAQAAEVTPQMVDEVVKGLQAAGTRFIISPYEADAQIAFLALQGHVDFCISEDSDLLALGCERVLFKLQADGQCKEVLLEDVLQGRSLEQFQMACILMGCDYLPRLPRLGPMTALRIADRCSAPCDIVREARAQGLNVPPDFLRSFEQALLVMRHQTVIDPISGRRTALREPPPGLFQESPRRQRGSRGSSRSSSRSRSRSQRRAAPLPLEDEWPASGRLEESTKGNSLQLVASAASAQPHEAVSASIFVSSGWEPARLCSQPRTSMEHFLQQEREALCLKSPDESRNPRASRLYSEDRSPSVTMRRSRFFGDWA